MSTSWIGGTASQFYLGTLALIKVREAYRNLGALGSHVCILALLVQGNLQYYAIVVATSTAGSVLALRPVDQAGAYNMFMVASMGICGPRLLRDMRRMLMYGEDDPTLKTIASLRFQLPVRKPAPVKTQETQTDTAPDLTAPAPAPASAPPRDTAPKPASAPPPKPPAPRKPARTTTPAQGHKIPPPPRDTAPPPGAQRSARANPRSRPAARLIVRYGDTGVLRGRPRPHPAIFRHSLNDALGGEWIAGIGYSRNGQLILHTKAPFTAQQLALRGDVLRPVIRSAFALEGDPRPLFETDDEWSKIVVHRVPLPVSGNPSEALNVKLQAFFMDVCTSNSFDPKVVRRMQPLCPKEKEEDYFRQSTAQAPQHLSVLLCISDTNLARRLLNHGAFWQGSHCRVSRYRERQRPVSG
ncbi:hypothetical protein EXIGLDRAFT_842823 [Exidia glandulosa HHB12029]|uniref:Uncharacterized protein n=1 Tax=Exidia glandulosa HHB12029 TaxID=1314781 RepID=A0A165D173_EXIGL|nr:hypothetical protein EXIGLDRAFT_842823 [Exidia glandulosa HHB12029]